MTDSFSISRFGCLPSAPASMPSASAPSTSTRLIESTPRSASRSRSMLERLLGVAGALADEVEQSGEERVAVQRAAGLLRGRGFDRHLLHDGLVLPVALVFPVRGGRGGRRRPRRRIGREAVGRERGRRHRRGRAAVAVRSHGIRGPPVGRRHGRVRRVAVGRRGRSRRRTGGAEEAEHDALLRVEEAGHHLLEPHHHRGGARRAPGPSVQERGRARWRTGAARRGGYQWCASSLVRVKRLPPRPPSLKGAGR